MATLNTDIYNISEFVEAIKAKHIEADENTLAMGMLGYLGDLFSHEIQNSIIVSSENSEEFFVTRSKFEKNIMTHAVTAKVSDINATPAKMEVLFGISEKEFLNNMVNDILYIDSMTPIYLGEYEFHLDYNIKITRNTSAITGDNIYIALYDMSKTNRISKITNPYLLPPYIMNIDGNRYIFIKSTIRQVEITKSYTKVITDDIIENKTFEFAFESQLADFKVIVNSGSTELELIPLFEGMPLEDPDKKYCYYTYIDSSTIRVSFIRDSYEPSLNTDITVLIQTTQGSSGVFKYTSDIIVKPESDEYVYTNMTFIVKPVTDSEYGINRKSISDLKSIIPKEILARGSITTIKDLENYFNSLGDNNNKMVFLKKIDNQFERTYYSYMLLKDIDENIIPSNTGTISILGSQADSESDSRYILKPGTIFKLDPITNIIERDLSVYTEEEITDLETNGFLYSSPFFIAINKSPLTLSFYLNLLDRRYLLLFNYINENSFIQFISTRVKWIRRLLEEPDTYNLQITLNQNTNENRNLIIADESGTITDSSKLRVFMILYNVEGEPLRYVEGSIVGYNKTELQYDYTIPFKTDDVILEDSSIKITNMYDIGSTDISVAYMKPTECKATIHIYAKFDIEYGRNGMDVLIPDMEGYSLCNTYEIDGGLDFFINFTDIVQSKVSVIPGVDNKFTLTSVPLIKYSYTQSKANIRYLIEYLVSRKIYIDSAQNLLGDQFGIDLKFFNTYGPSKVFTIGYGKLPLDKVNLKLKFRAKVLSTAPENIKDLMISFIKSYIEEITDSKTDLHISKLIAEITNTFLELSFMEFLGINNYDTTYQYIERRDLDGHYVPEFLNINSTESDYYPDIQIDLI